MRWSGWWRTRLSYGRRRGRATGRCGRMAGRPRATKPRLSRGRLVTWRCFEKGLTRHDPILAGLIAQPVAEALPDRPGADLALLVDGEITDLLHLRLRLFLQDALDRRFAGRLR